MTVAPTTVFVTSNGEADGVGVALIKRFAREGARVVVAGSDPVYGTVLMGEIASTGGDASFVLTDLDQVAPGARDFLKAVKNGHVISMDRFYVYPTTFASFDYVLDQLELLVK